ncbi:MAG: hypothetical protein GY839_17170 [candidate division Zixibacteria bacterium]|nr:hypothetical protein [candidate division Zixibacteria bacterium]
MKLAVDLLFGLVFCISLGGLGVVFFGKVLKQKIDFFTGFFAGCGLSVIILFLAGILGAYSSVFFVVYMIFVFIFAIPGRRALARYEFSINRSYLIPLLLLAGVLLIAGLSSLSPPIKNDTLYYHLGLPKLWAGDGGIQFYPFIALSTTALNSEVLLTPIVSFISPEAAQFFVFLIGVMVIMLLARGYNRITGGSSALPLIVMGAIPLFMSSLTDAKNDYLATGFVLASFMFYFDYHESNKFKQLVFAGIFAGLAASTKTNSLIFVLALLAILIISRHRLKDISLFCLIALLFGLPWYLKSYILTGNPVYPFFNGLFDSPYWHPVFDSFNQATNVQSENQTVINFITSPFRLAYFPDIFRGRMGPVPFVFLPLILLLKDVPMIIYKALLISLVFFLFWYIAWPNARYLMPIIPFLALAAAYIVEKLFRVSRSSGLIAVAGICLLTAISGVQLVRDGAYRIKTAVGLVDRDEFLQTVSVLNPNQLSSSQKVLALPYYNIWQFLNATSEPEAVVGILCSNWNRADGFYLDRSFVYLNPSDQISVDFTSGRTVMARDLVEHNVRYILLDRFVIEEFSPNSDFGDTPGFDIFSRGVFEFTDIIKRNGRLIYLTDRFELYRIKNLSVISEEPFS